MNGAVEDAERFRLYVAELYHAYLRMFPQEKERLARLGACIERRAPLHTRTSMAGHVTASAYVLAPGEAGAEDAAFSGGERGGSTMEDGGNLRMGDGGGKPSSLLVVYHRALGYWLAPGGHYEAADGDLVHCALREAYEETGVTGLALDSWHERFAIPLDIDVHVIPRNPAKGEDEHYHFDCRYVFRAPAGALLGDFSEVRAVEWRPLREITPREHVYPVVQKIKRLLL